MTRISPRYFLAFLSVCLVGCGADPYARFELGPARDVVKDAIEVMGGLERWQAVGPIRARAVVTIYDESGSAVVNRHEQLIDLRAGRIQASARVPGGRWTATVHASGRASFKADGVALGPEFRSRLLAALKTLLHRLRGPMNLCGQGEKAGKVSRARVDGMELVRVAASGGSADVAAYYFDAQSKLLTLLTTGDDAPGGQGTVTRYTYQMLPNGMAFPARISVVRIGRHTLIGTRPVLAVEYHDIRP